MANVNLESKPLPQGAVVEVPKVALWLQTSAANFQVLDNVNICRNTDGLAKATSCLFKQFATEVTCAPSQNRVTAIHFNRPSVVPVEKGWIVDLIPVHIVENAVMVENQQLDANHYVRLTKETSVSGNFFAVLLLSQLST
ncbi:hypothetical protein K449DRAFT_430292 [Hypoxylon sp. EC38]|nr:hypothetical protein K449DRAFT_430292 [Hypoxylon sp. EC38]